MKFAQDVHLQLGDVDAVRILDVHSLLRMSAESANVVPFFKILQDVELETNTPHYAIVSPHTASSGVLVSL